MDTITSFKSLSVKMSEVEYHNRMTFSYSILSKYARDGFQSLPTLFDKTESTKAMQRGSLIDAMITNRDKLNNDYVVMDNECPAAESSVLKLLANDMDSATLDGIDDATIVNYCNKCSYRTNLKDDTRVKKVREQGDYYPIYKFGRIPVSKKEWLDAMNTVSSFNNSSLMSDLFRDEESDDVEYLYQQKYLVNFEVGFDEIVPVKAMLDLVIVNHKYKTIRPIDLKTSANPAYMFKDNFIKYRYDIQAQLYTDVLTKVKNDSNAFAEYEVLPFQFAVISPSDNVPLLFEYNPYDGINDDGFQFVSKGKTYKYKRWDELANEIMKYMENNAAVPEGFKTDEVNSLNNMLLCGE